MWILTDVAGAHAFTEDGLFVPHPYKDRPHVGVAMFETKDEAERVRFVLRWAKQCHTVPMEVK